MFLTAWLFHSSGWLEVELLANEWESFTDLETRGQHVATLLFQRVGNNSYGAFLNETLPWKDAGPESSGEIRISHSGKLTDFRFLSFSVYLPSILLHDIWKSIGKIPDCLPGAQGRQQRELSPCFGTELSSESSALSGSSFLIAGGNRGRHLKGKVADGGRAEIWSGAQLGDSRFCFWESGVSWGLIQQHASSLWLTLS